MLSLRRRQIVLVVLEAAIDGIHLRFALHKETKMKALGISAIRGSPGLHQRQDETIIVRQHVKAGVSALALQSEIRFKNALAACTSVTIRWRWFSFIAGSATVGP